MQPDSTAPGSRTTRLRLAAIVLAAAVLRLIFLGARSFWSDEIVSVKLATDSWRGFTFWIMQREANMVLYYLALRGWVRLGDSESWVRLLSAIFGILTVPVFYLLAKRWFGERPAWIAALLAASSACMVEFSQEARSYSLLILLVVLSYFYFEKMLREQSLWPSAWYVIFSAAALYAHFFAGLVICAQLVSLLWLPWRQLPRSRLAGSFIVIGAFAVPIFLYVLRNDVGQLYWVEPTTFAEVYKLLIFFAGGPKATAAVISVISLGACIGAVLRLRARFASRSEDSWKAAAVLTWAAVPPLLAIIVSFHRPVFVHRYLLVSLPGYLLLVALGFDGLKKCGLAAGLAVLLALSSISIAQDYFRPVEDWRGAVDYIFQNSQPGDALLVYIPYGNNNFNFYARRFERTQKHLPLKRRDDSQPPPPESLTAPRAWLILYPSPHTAELAPQFEAALNTRYQDHKQFSFRGLSLELFSGLTPPPSPRPAESAPRP